MTKAECIEFVRAHMQIMPATSNGAYTCGRMLSPPKSGLTHSVGCAQPRALVFFRNMNKSSAGWGVDAILGDFDKGDGVILVTLRWDEEAKKCSRPWGCGAGKNGSYNNTHVQWEVCEPAGHTYAGGTMVGYDVAKNQPYFDRMWKMLVAWNVYCCVTFGYDASWLKDHSESYRDGMGSNHSDISQWLPKHGKSMDALRREVQDILDEKEPEVPEMTYEQWLQFMQRYRSEHSDNDCSDWSAAARQWNETVKLINGYGNGKMGWEDFLTREQAIVLFNRFLDIARKSLGEEFKHMLEEALKKL